MPDSYFKAHPIQARLVKLLPVGMAITMASFALAGYTLLTRADDAARERDRVCRVATGDRKVLRDLLILAQTTSRTTLKNNPQQYERAQRFYLQALALIKPVNCNDL